MDVSEAAESGDRRALLVAMRDRLVEAFGRTTSGRDMITLSRQIEALAREITSLDARERPQLRAVPDEPYDGTDT